MQERRRRLRRHHAVAVVSALIGALTVLCTASGAYAQSCTRQANAATNADLWDRPPEFSTSKGRVYGTLVGQLQSGVQVFICREVSVGFGFSTEKWYQIAFYSSDEWHYAWVAARDIRVHGSAVRQEEGVFAFAGTAFAAPPSGQKQLIAESPPAGSVPAVPPHPPLAAAFEAETGGIQLQFYLFLFVSLVLGIVGKAVIDVFGAQDMTAKKIVKKLTVSLIMAPTVFLGFMKTADLNVETNVHLLILMLLAFQAGLFWQSYFEKRKEG